MSFKLDQNDDSRFNPEHDGYELLDRPERLDDISIDDPKACDAASETPIGNEEWTTRRLLAINDVVKRLACTCVLYFTSAGLWAVALVFFYTPVNSGSVNPPFLHCVIMLMAGSHGFSCSGLGLQVHSMGNALGIEGLLAMVATLFIYPRLVSHYGTTYAYQLTTTAAIPTILMMPLMRWVVITVEGNEAGIDPEKPRSWIIWATVLVWLILQMFAALAFSFDLAVLNMGSPNKKALNKLNGLSVTAG